MLTYGKFVKMKVLLQANFIILKRNLSTRVFSYKFRTLKVPSIVCNMMKVFFTIFPHLRLFYSILLGYYPSKDGLDQFEIYLVYNGKQKDFSI
jgi:hypothetical protein